MKLILSVATFIVLMSTSFAQKGSISGTLTDAKTGETLPFVNVYTKADVTKGTSTDFDGNYKLQLEAGTYEIVYSFTSYKKVIKPVTIIAGESIIATFKMEESSQELIEFKVVGQSKAAKTMAAFDRSKMNNTNMVDGTSNEQMKKTGDSDAGEVIKRITGVSVIDGKEVYVRGLGDRYTKTILNGMSIPGLDPDKNTVQMDVFPTNLIDNITVYKTFSPELPGNYTGGLVDIVTKDFPSQKTLSFSVGGSFNSATTLNNNFILYDRGRFDAFGFDDGSRAMPVNANKKFPDPTTNDKELTTLTKKFDPQMAVSKAKALPNQNYSFGIGNQIKPEGKNYAYGYNFYVNYANQYSFYEDVTFGSYRKDSESKENELYPDRISKGATGSQNVIWSALLGQSIKYNKNNKISFNVFHTQNGQSQAAMLTENNYENNPATLVKQSLQYTQRSVSNVNLMGKHTLANKKWQVKWSVSPSLSKISDPDIRSTVLEQEEDATVEGGYTYSLNQSVGGEIRRIYRDLNEFDIHGKLDFEYDFDLKNKLTSKIKFGASEIFKTRSFEVYDFVFNLENVNQSSSDPNWYFEDQNIWTPETDKGLYADGERELSNSFEATQTIMAAYLMNELPVSEKFKAIYGVRMEKVTNTYTGQNNDGTIIYNDDVVLDETNFLPAINLVYLLKEVKSNKMNLRGSYSQTVARPSFKEKSIAQIYDPIQGRRYNGNIDLMQTNIHNSDLRWEYFYGRTEVLSASVFYKKFLNPIELVSFDIAPNEVKPTNAGEATVYGIELEARKRIGLKESNSKKCYIGTNFTWIKSQIDMNKVLITKGDSFQTEKEIRQANARNGEVIKDYRPMYGQSPYLINAFASYSDDSLGLDLNLSYNVQGKRLAVIGIGALPDVYENPFHSLNFKASKKLGEKQQWKASLSVQNILNNNKTRVYDSYQAEPQIYDFYRRGRTYSVTISYMLK